MEGASGCTFLAFVYYVPIVLLDNLVLTDGLTAAEKWKLVLPSFQCVTKSPNWFLRTYLWLYLLSPMVNKFMESSRRNKWALFIICIIIDKLLALVLGPLQKAIVARIDSIRCRGGLADERQ